MKRNLTILALVFTFSLTAIFINHSNKKQINSFTDKNKELKLQLQQVKEEEASLNKEKTKLLKDKENIENKIKKVSSSSK